MVVCRAAKRTKKRSEAPNLDRDWYTAAVVDAVRILIVVVAGPWVLGCTQVHDLGQLGSSADGATSILTEESGETTSSDSEPDTGSEETETGTEDSGETDGPIPDPCDIVDLGGNEGVSIEITLMTQWDAGACHDFRVTNDTPDDVIWTRDLRFGGTLDNYWNAEGEALSSTDWRFGGQASAGNVVVFSGATITFGSCMICTP